MKSFLVVSPIYIRDKDAFSGVTRGADGLMSDMKIHMCASHVRHDAIVCVTNKDLFDEHVYMCVRVCVCVCVCVHANVCVRIYQRASF